MNVKTLCLGILYFSEMSGYDIRKKASEGQFSHFCEANFGSIYPALNQLHQEGLVDVREEQQQGKPGRKVYSLNSKGKEALLNGLFDQPRPDIFKSEFLFFSLFAEILPKERVIDLLNTKRQQLQEELNNLQQCYGRCEHIPSRFAIGYGITLKQAALAYMEKTEKDLISSAAKNDQVSAAE